MIQTYTIEQLYDRLQAAIERGEPIAVLCTKADYERALIVAARAKQGEY